MGKEYGEKAEKYEGTKWIKLRKSGRTGAVLT
jgi:hypothetical protein